MYAYPEQKGNTIDKYDEPRIHMERLMKVRLVEFDISLRILIPLEKVGIRTLGDLTECTQGDLMGISQLGKTAVEKLTAFLNRYGLSLRT